MNQSRTGRCSFYFLIGICNRNQRNSNDMLLDETFHCLEKLYLQFCLDAGIWSLPVRIWCLLALRVWAICVHLYGEATEKATLFQGTTWCNWISTLCCILTIVSSGTKARPAFLIKEMGMSRTDGEVPICFPFLLLLLLTTRCWWLDESVDDNLLVDFIRFWREHI